MRGSAWAEHTCFILGGGPSVKNLDLGRLKGALVVGCNDAGLHAATPVLFSLDNNYCRWWKDHGRSYQGEVYQAVMSSFPQEAVVPGVHYLRRARDEAAGLSHTPGTIHGNNSGYGALNLAFLMGAKKIVLLGFDMRRNGHWHAGYPGHPHNVDLIHWAPPFELAAQQLEAAGVEVLNACPSSSINSFRKITLEEACSLLPPKSKPYTRSSSAS